MAAAFPLWAQSFSVAAASDLAALEQPLAEGLRTRGPARPVFTLGSSGMLARQIASGAPFDVFLSADEGRVSQLAAGGLLEPGSLAVYALGRLGIWSKSGRYQTIEDLRAGGITHVVIANPAHAPYGAAAKAALEKAGLWKRLEGRVVLAENVRHALEYAESGNADAVVTAWSLVYNRGGFLVPESLHPPIRQSGGVVRGCAHPDGARTLLSFLLSPEGQDLLARHGFARVR